MKNAWTWIALLLIAFNLLLSLSYLSRKNVEQLFTEITNGPTVSDFAERNERVCQAFPLAYYEHKELSVRFAQSSQKFTEAIKALYSSTYSADKISFFKKKRSITDPLQDSLWTAFKAYREAVDKILGQVLPLRQDYYERYLKAASIEREMKQQVSIERKKILQTSLDTAARLSNDRIYEINLDDEKRLQGFIGFMLLRSEPAEELNMNNQLAKMDALFAAKGKLMLYGKLYRLNELTEAQRRQLYYFSVIVKSEADQQLLDLVRP